MSRSIFLLAVVVFCLAGAIARAEDLLNIGDTPPPLALSSFVKGDKIDSFEPGKTYVVEFWATWCGPCRASIPHLTELAHQYKDVQFIGVDVWEHELDKVQPFVDEMGDKMDYRVALDTIMDKEKPRDGTMAKTWMAAAEEDGIPTAFVIHDGIIAWIGHPMDLEEPLKQILAGQWDLEAASKQRFEQIEKQRKIIAAQNKIRGPYQNKDYKALIVAVDEVIKDNPELAGDFISYKFAALCNSGDTEAGLELGDILLEKYNDNARELNTCFWDVIAPDLVDNVNPRVAQLALKATQRAVELTKEDMPQYLDSLAEAQFRTGDAKGAVATEEKAIKGLREKYKDLPDSYFKQFDDRLSRYRKAVDSAAQKSSDKTD